MKKYFLPFVCLCIISSCGNPNKTVQLKLTDATIQRDIYGLSLGNSYTEPELIGILAQTVKGLTSAEDRSIWTNNPYLFVQDKNNYKYCWIATDKFYEGFLFGNVYWDDYRMNITNDGRIYYIEFTTAVSSKDEFDEGYKDLLTTLSKKYGEPNHFDYGANGQEIWFDGKTQLDLEWEKGSKDYYVSVTYTDVPISNEIRELQKNVGESEF